MNKIFFCATSLAVVCGVSFSAFAQSDDETVRGAETQLQRQQGVSAPGGIDALVSAAREVSYQELLADPDNIELNILYARGQIAKGNLTDAQSALERVLLLHPEITVVKMLYGLVLFRLDNIVDAEAVFKELLDSDISTVDKEMVNEYLAKITDKQKRTRYSVSVSMGMHYDDNKNSATRSGELSLVDVVFDAGAKEEGDYGTIVSTSGEVRHDLGRQFPMDAYAKVTLMGDQQSRLETQNMMLARFDVGTSMVMPIGALDFSANFSDININRKAYMTTTGLKARWDGNPRETFSPYLEGNYQYQFYNGHQGDTAAPQKTGNRWDGKAGARIPGLIENGISDVSVSYTRKQARATYNEFSGYGLSLGHTQVFDKGRFLLGSVSYNNEKYARADPFINTTKKRHDRRYGASLTAGAPLGSFAKNGELPESLNDVVITATLARSDAHSNIVNYSYNNWRSQFMLNKTIRF